MPGWSLGSVLPGRTPRGGCRRRGDALSPRRCPARGAAQARAVPGGRGGSGRCCGIPRPPPGVPEEEESSPGAGRGEQPEGAEQGWAAAEPPAPAMGIQEQPVLRRRERLLIAGTGSRASPSLAGKGIEYLPHARPRWHCWPGWQYLEQDGFSWCPVCHFYLLRKGLRPLRHGQRGSASGARREARAIPGTQEVHCVQHRPCVCSWLPAGRVGARAFAPKLTLWATAQISRELRQTGAGRGSSRESFKELGWESRASSSGSCSLVKHSRILSAPRH